MTEWIVAEVTGLGFYCWEIEGSRPTGEKYDPKVVSGMTARHHMRTRLLEKKAKALVDKLNGPRGDLKKVGGD